MHMLLHDIKMRPPNLKENMENKVTPGFFKKKLRIIKYTMVLNIKVRSWLYLR